MLTWIYVFFSKITVWEVWFTSKKKRDLKVHGSYVYDIIGSTRRILISKLNYNKDVINGDWSGLTLTISKRPSALAFPVLPMDLPTILELKLSHVL